MKKKILIASAILAIGILPFLRNLSTHEVKGSLLQANIEALTDNEAESSGTTCYYINVFTSDAPLLLSCGNCAYKYGHGRPVGKCPN